MFAGNPFYHGHTKNTIIAFARLFSDIVIQRQNNSGVVEQTIAVPIAYANKDKMLRRVEADPKLDKHIRVSLPRLAFEITNYAYDADRHMNRTNNIICNSPTPEDPGRRQAYAPVPWNIEIALYVVTKTQEDGLQILEQILPYFAPEYNLLLSMVPELNIKQTVPVILNSVGVEDNYDGSYENDPRIVIHTLSFTLKTNFYGPVTDGKIIKHVTVDVYDGLENQMSQYKADGTIPTEPITEQWLYEF